MRERIRQRAYELGFDLCRFTTADSPQSAPQFQAWLESGQHGEMAYLQRNAHKRVEPGRVLPGVQSVVTLAISYYPAGGGGESVEPGTTRLDSKDRSNTGIVARYARYADYHDVLAERLRMLTETIDQAGDDETRSLWYVDTGPVLERDLAQRAGIGFIGKHTNLISRQYGNWLFLSEILTTLKLEPDASETNRCGTCTRCIAACPTRAITGPFQLDARLCISYLTIELKGSIPESLRPAIGNRIFGCDDCLEVCPWNRFAKEGRLMREHRRRDLDQPELLELLRLDKEGFKRRFAGTPILRSKRRGLLRNVCVALGNVGDANALPDLQRAANDPEPFIAEHAQWAIVQIRTRAKEQPGE